MNFKAIDYARTLQGAICNGIVSDGDGEPDAAWTCDLDGRLTTLVLPVSQEVFAGLWDGIMASMARHGVFWRHLVTDPTRLIDPGLNHVIAAVSGQGGWQCHLTFLIPADEASHEFTTWLETLAVPAAASPAMADA